MRFRLAASPILAIAALGMLAAAATPLPTVGQATAAECFQKCQERRKEQLERERRARELAQGQAHLQSVIQQLQQQFASPFQAGGTAPGMSQYYQQAAAAYRQAALRAPGDQAQYYRLQADYHECLASQLVSGASNLCSAPRAEPDWAAGETLGASSESYAHSQSAMAVAAEVLQSDAALNPEFYGSTEGTIAAGGVLLAAGLIDLFSGADAEQERLEEQLREEEERKARERAMREEAEERERQQNPRRWYYTRYATLEEGLTVAREELLTGKLSAERGRMAAAHNSFVSAAKILQVMPGIFPGDAQVLGTQQFFAEMLASAQRACLAEAAVAFRRGDAVPACGFGDPNTAGPTTLLPLEQRLVRAKEEAIEADLANTRGDYAAAQTGFSSAFAISAELTTEFPGTAAVEEFHRMLLDRATEAEQTCLVERRVRFRRGEVDLPTCAYVPDHRRS